MEEVLSNTKAKIPLDIEIKHESVTDTAEGGIVDKTLMHVINAGMEEEVIFSSFDYKVMQHLNMLASNIPKAILYERTQSGELIPPQLIEKYAANAFICNYKLLTKEWMED